MGSCVAYALCACVLCACVCVHACVRADSRFIASGSGDKRAKLWDVGSGYCIRTFGDESGPRDGVTSVALSPDGRCIDMNVHVVCKNVYKSVRKGLWTGLHMPL